VRETCVPQCVSERLCTRFAFREVLEHGAAHVVMPDLIWTGGLTEAVKIAALADTYHLPIAPHDCTGPINLIACLHLCAAMPNAMIMEIVRGFVRGYYTELLTAPIDLRDGRVVLQFGPGLGTTLRPEVFDKQNMRRRVSEIERSAIKA
jgi:galactonate dehydratase